MSFIPFFIPFLLIGSFALMIFTIAKTLDKKRTEGMKNYAMQRGFAFVDRPNISEFQRFKVFSKGHGKIAKNMLRGTKNNKEIQIFDYKYTIGYGKNQRTYNQSVFVAKLNKVLPDFTLGPENFFHKIGDLFGFKDIDFQMYPKFSKKYLLKGDSVASIKSIFNSDVIHFFENKEFRYNVEVQGNMALIYRLSKKVNIDLINQFMDDNLQIVNKFDR